MSDQDFFRGLRDDIVDTTRKMMEDAAGSEAKIKKPAVQTANVSELEKNSVSASQGTEDAGDAVAKVLMEFVQLETEKRVVEKVETPSCTKVTAEKADPEEPPPGIPDVVVEKAETKSKKEAKQKEVKSRAAKWKEAKHKETKHKVVEVKEHRKKEAKVSKSSEPPAEGMEQLMYLTDMIMNIKEQIDEIKGEYDHRETRPAMDRAEPHKPTTVARSKKDKAKPVIKEKKARAAELDSESKRKDPKRTDKKLGIESKDKQLATKPVPSSNSEEVSSEQKLLLKLFTLSSSQRRKYIEKRGIELGLLDPHPYKSHVVVVNRRVQNLSETLFAEARGYIAQTTNSEEKGVRVEVVEKAKQKHATFEEQVTLLLNNGKQCASEEYSPELTLAGVRDEAHTIVQDRLESFVGQLVERNVGYLVEGLLRINARNHLQSFVDDATRVGNVYINSILLRRCAMDGDVVRVFVLKDSVTVAPSPEAPTAEGERLCLDNTIDSTGEPDVTQKPSISQNNVGFVVTILERRHNRQCVGKFLPFAAGKKHYRTFMPRDTRIPPLRVFKQDWPNALIESKPVVPHEGPDGMADKQDDPLDVTNVLYQAEIIEWQNDVPIGTILKSIGKCGVLEVENESILAEYSLDVTPYAETILAQLPSVPYIIPAEEMARREDLRGECIFTIDPATARDLDDALSCKVLPNGNFEIGVHISDVTYFLRERSDLDEIVKLRATSIYMVDTVYHMLPKQLCNTCSLLPGEDKLAFSVIWEMLPDATVVSTRFARSVINSCAQLSYEHAQMMLDNREGRDLNEDPFPEILHGHTVGSLATIVNRMQSIAVKIRQRRMDNGCLKINQPKLTFRLDPATGRPIEYGVYQLRASNEMIEDFMLLANTSVAEAIHAAFPSTSLLRSHKPPAENMMKNLVRTLATHGYSFSFASSNAIRESMETIVADAEHSDAAISVLNILLAKPMTRAQYYCSAFASGPNQFKHYALAIPMYTHFTSPIRRYADCLVHRVLAAMLRIDEEPKRTPDELQQLATICNEKKYNAKLAGDASSMLYYRQWLGTVKQHETVGAVLGYAAHHIELVLIHTGIVVKVMTKKVSAVSAVVFKPTETVGSIRLIPKDTSIKPVTLKIFSKVRVTIKLSHDAISVVSILPMAAESDINKEKLEAPGEPSVTDVSPEMKSARVY